MVHYASVCIFRFSETLRSQMKADLLTWWVVQRLCCCTAFLFSVHFTFLSSVCCVKILTYVCKTRKASGRWTFFSLNVLPSLKRNKTFTESENDIVLFGYFASTLNLCYVSYVCRPISPFNVN